MANYNSPPKKIEIYQLVDPRDGKPFYVGQSVDSQKRLEAHIKDAFDSPTRTRIKDILSTGQSPLLVVSSVVSEEMANRAERELIRLTPDLTNIQNNNTKNKPKEDPSQPRKRRRDYRKQSEWAKSLIPQLHEARDIAYKKRVAARVVPEISIKAWEKIEPILSNPKNVMVDVYDLAAVTGYHHSYFSKGKWLNAIAREFPDEWEVGTVGLPEGGWRKVIRRKETNS